jgi:alkanesulfonate monooxygenase SsuD/methylene tetrahydromethanopterin reductase-like flavin-dependent oxidoreductase (luciferase family)
MEVLCEGDRVSKHEIAIEFWPWDTLDNLRAWGRQAVASYPYDHVWVCDEFQYEDAITLLGVMAMELDASVGTLVTFPWRNPMELAQRFATMAKLTRPGRGVAIGLGAGGAVQVQVIGEKTNPMPVMRESLILLRGLLAGDEVPLGDVPELAARFRYNTKTKARLHFPPPSPVPVYLASGGPGMAKLAGELADGAVLSQLVLRTSYRGARMGMLGEVAGILDTSRAAGVPDRPFKKIYNFHISVARDGRAAKEWAKRNTSYGVSGTFIRYPEVLDQLGLDREEIGHVAEAYLSGLGINEAAKRVSDKLVVDAGAVFAGTPEEVVEPLREMMTLLTTHGFDHFVFGVPLGPDVPAALDLIGKEVIPAVLA